MYNIITKENKKYTPEDYYSTKLELIETCMNYDYMILYEYEQNNYVLESSGIIDKIKNFFKKIYLYIKRLIKFVIRGSISYDGVTTDTKTGKITDIPDLKFLKKLKIDNPVEIATKYGSFLDQRFIVNFKVYRDDIADNMELLAAITEKIYEGIMQSSDKLDDIKNEYNDKIDSLEKDISDIDMEFDIFTTFNKRIEIYTISNDVISELCDNIEMMKNVYNFMISKFSDIEYNMKMIVKMMDKYKISFSDEMNTFLTRMSNGLSKIVQILPSNIDKLMKLFDYFGNLVTDIDIAVNKNGDIQRMA